MATYKIHALQQALDDSVAAKDLENANRQYNELTAKYRDLLQRENTLVSRSAMVENLEVPYMNIILSPVQNLLNSSHISVLTRMPLL